MLEKFDVRPQLENESENEYEKYIENLINQVIIMNDIVENKFYYYDTKNKIILKGTFEEIEEYKEPEKKSKRINLWVTDSFYKDIQTLHQAYSDMSISEMIVELTNNYIDYLKTDQFWETLENWQNIKKSRSKVFENFVKSKNEDLDKE